MDKGTAPIREARVSQRHHLHVSVELLLRPGSGIQVFNSAGAAPAFAEADTSRAGGGGFASAAVVGLRDPPRAPPGFAGAPGGFADGRHANKPCRTGAAGAPAERPAGAEAVLEKMEGGRGSNLTAFSTMSKIRIQEAVVGWVQN